MIADFEVHRGKRYLRNFLAREQIDWSQMDVAELQQWLEKQLPFWQRDVIFSLRCQIRDLRKTHPAFVDLEAKHEKLQKAHELSPQYARLQELDNELLGVEKAIAGLTTASNHARGDRKHQLNAKLNDYRQLQQQLTLEQANLLQQSTTYQQLQQTQKELTSLGHNIGLTDLELQLEQLNRAHGKKQNVSGESFEVVSKNVTQQWIVPDLVKSPSAEIAILSGVTLGAADMEFDHLVVRVPPQSQKALTVLAMVEAKRNINDLAHGFRRRQQDLAWLTGDVGGYDPALYKTQTFPTGHFDRMSQHHEEGTTYHLDQSSFRNFRREEHTGKFLNRLYFISREGRLWGLSNAALARLRHRVATDYHFDLKDNNYLTKLLYWCQSLIEPPETPDVLEMYCQGMGHAKQILLLRKQGE